LVDNMDEVSDLILSSSSSSSSSSFFVIWLIKFT
jgi:hypothetical protein